MVRKRGAKRRLTPDRAGLWNKTDDSEPYRKGNRRPFNNFKQESHKTQRAL